MMKADVLFEIGKACPDLTDEILALLERLDKSGNFHGPAKEANEKRFAKVCRDALETGEFPKMLELELKKIEATLTGPGRPAMTDDEKRKPRSIKMSDHEWLELQQRAAEAGVSVAEYIRIKTLARD